jgi:deoxyribodipyrimidine photolyase-like uncharacterized protein
VAETVECPTCTDRIPIEETWVFKELEHARGQHAKDVLLTAALEVRLDQLRADLARVTEERAKDRERDTATMQTLLDIASEDLAASRAETARLREALEKYTTCWHCGDALLEEDPYHCEACPAWDCCDEGDCDAPGCIERTSDPEPTT